MKKVLRFLITVFLLISFSPLSVKAHPGKTDANGCHTCKTNCEKYGLDYGEYHCHNGGGSGSSGGNSSTQNKPAPPTSQAAPSQKEPVKPIEKKIDYASIGKKDGYNFKIKNPDKELNEANYTYSESAYKSAYKTAYEKAENELKDKTIKLASENGEKDATKSENYSLSSIPSGVMSKVYKEYYKTAFDDMVNRIKTELKDDADKRAFALVFDEKDNGKPNIYDLKKYEDLYSNEFKDKKAAYEKDKKAVLKSANENGKADAGNRDSKNYRFIEKYKNTKFYNEVKKVYDKSYEENKSEGNPIIGGVVFIIVIVGMVWFVKKRKKKIA